MAPLVLGLGLAHNSLLVPPHLTPLVQKALDTMQFDMQVSPYDWHMFYVEPHMDLNDLVQKLREREWDVVMVGMGLRNGSQLTAFFETIVNAVHRELPKARFSFNRTIEGTREDVKRAIEAEV